MKSFLLRVLKRSLPVMAVLAAIGYAQGLILYNVMNVPSFESQAGVEHTAVQAAATTPADPSKNDAAELLWRVPLTLALFGFLVVLALETFDTFIRRKRAKSLNLRLEMKTKHVIHLPAAETTLSR